MSGFASQDGWHIGGWLTTIFAVLLSHIFTGRREKKRDSGLEFQVKLSQLIDLVNQLQNVSFAYYTSSEGNAEFAMRLKIDGLFSQLDGAWVFLETKDAKAASAVSKKVSTFYEAVTDGNFGSKDRALDELRDEQRCKRIALAAQHLITYIREIAPRKES